ncbi:iron-sulfur cluster biosynthesis family protein [Paenibacillus sp. J2TS4]|uniref:iron-sulfur cluster biosynthesis family protein n=1 Tax=Paenibacillus sp. J2TS4 TaxID=2807194 RepID=UPI001B06E466|nr:iron-sulfur cluster biosynthesis family protein [Paenibacillus sp. J2TS4]GIP32566.1 hypothetical protein J2TS4_17760 [Paenibacillus sp. J2TS4]
MRIEVRDAAERAIINRLGGSGFTLKLVYDSEGCGCAVSGVPQIWVIDPIEPSADNPAAALSPVLILYEKRQEVFFEEQMRLDYDTEKKAFQLKSDQQIYNAGITLLDKRSAAGERR